MFQCDILYNLAIEMKLLKVGSLTDLTSATSFLKLGRAIGKRFLHHVT